MKKYIRPILIAAGGILLLLAIAATLFFTALRPLCVEAGAALPTPADYARYPFLVPTDGEGENHTSLPGEQTVHLHLLGIPRRTTLTVADTVPPAAATVERTVFLGEVLAAEEFCADLTDATPITVSYAGPAPDFHRPGTQTVKLRLTDAAGNEKRLEATLRVHALSADFVVEAGISADELAEQIVGAVEGRVQFDEDFSLFDSSALGRHALPIYLNGEWVTLGLNVTDTTPPTAKMLLLPLLSGQPLEASAFLSSVTDATRVTAEFTEEPDLSVGRRVLKLRLTDAAGNTADVYGGVQVYDAPAAADVELGQYTAEELLLHLTGNTGLKGDAALLASPSLGGLDFPLTTPRGETLIQRITFVDTKPPVGKTVNRVAYVGDEIEAAAFLEATADATEVTASYTDGKAPVLDQPGTHALSITLTDAANNKTELSATLTVIYDTEPPVLSGVGDKTVYLGESVSYQRGVSAADNRDGAVKVSVDSSAVKLRVPGKYPVTYSAVDAAGNEVKRTVTYTVSAIDTTAVNALADAVLARIIRPGMTELERARAIYDWATLNLRYTAYADKSDPVGAAFYGFRNGRGDCFVYYAVSRFLLTRAGFENLEIHRDSVTNPHFWNLVKYEGNWYHFDTCPHYAAHPLTCFLLTDSEVKHYSDTRVPDYYSFDPSLYPATP